VIKALRLEFFLNLLVLLDALVPLVGLIGEGVEQKCVELGEEVA